MDILPRLIFPAVTALVIALAGACGDDATPSPAPHTPTVSPTPAERGVVVTFRVAGREEYRALLTDPADIEVARKLLAGEEAPSIPNGIVKRDGPGVNAGYSWHIDPDSVEFADTTTEVCDGLPSDVEAQAITSDRYCPWAAVVVAVTTVPGD